MVKVIQEVARDTPRADTARVDLNAASLERAKADITERVTPDLGDDLFAKKFDIWTGGEPNMDGYASFVSLKVGSEEQKIQGKFAAQVAGRLNFLLQKAEGGPESDRAREILAKAFGLPSNPPDFKALKQSVETFMSDLRNDTLSEINSLEEDKNLSTSDRYNEKSRLQLQIDNKLDEIEHRTSISIRTTRQQNRIQRIVFNLKKEVASLERKLNALDQKPEKGLNRDELMRLGKVQDKTVQYYAELGRQRHGGQSHGINVEALFEGSRAHARYLHAHPIAAKHLDRDGYIDNLARQRVINEASSTEVRTVAPAFLKPGDPGFDEAVRESTMLLIENEAVPRHYSRAVNRAATLAVSTLKPGEPNFEQAVQKVQALIAQDRKLPQYLSQEVREAALLGDRGSRASTGSSATTGTRHTERHEDSRPARNSVVADVIENIRSHNAERKQQSMRVDATIESLNRAYQNDQDRTGLLSKLAENRADYFALGKKVYEALKDPEKAQQLNLKDRDGRPLAPEELKKRVQELWKEVLQYYKENLRAKPAATVRTGVAATPTTPRQSRESSPTQSNLNSLHNRELASAIWQRAHEAPQLLDGILKNLSVEQMQELRSQIEAVKKKGIKDSGRTFVAMDQGLAQLEKQNQIPGTLVA